MVEHGISGLLTDLQNMCTIVADNRCKLSVSIVNDLFF